MKQFRFIIRKHTEGIYLANSACKDISARGGDLGQVISNIYQELARRYSGSIKEHIIHLRFDKKEMAS